MEQLVMIIFIIIGLFVLYSLIELAVRRGIDTSMIGEHLKEKYGVNDEKKSFLDDDLDDDLQ